MIDYNNLQILPAIKLPKGEDAPLDNLIGLYKLCNKMQTLCAKSNGVGLSAVQVGVPWNIFIARDSNNNYDYYLNCKYEGVGEKIKSIEGCLSILDEDGKFRQFELERFAEIKLSGNKLIFGNVNPYINLTVIKDQSVKGFNCIVLQHEIDHASGILVSDRGKEIKVW